MTKLAILVSLLAAACGASQPRISVTPQQRAAAIEMYMSGASTGQVAERLTMQPADARELIHTTIVELNRHYYQAR